MIKDLLSLTKGPESLRLCLYGRSGTGKTARINAAAKALGLPVFRLLLQSMQSEDVLGLPRVVDGRTVWSIPDWAAELTKRPGILFLDELDKPRTDVTDAVLTLLWEARIRDIKLHPDCIIVAAMQPVDKSLWLMDESRIALSARLIFVPISQAEGYKYVAENLGAAWAKELASHEQELELPTLDSPPPPRILAESIRLARAGFPADILARGVASEPWASWLSGKLMQEAGLRPVEIADPIDLAKTLPLEQLFVQALDWAIHGPSAAWGEALYRIWTEGTEEEAERFLDEQWRRVSETAQMCGDEPLEQVLGIFKDVCRRVYDNWSEKGGQP